ncbi:hypothetical protein I5192_20105 (plasmid) [Ruegeria sp. SCSIO 43209]|uniref:hypothetical protein n=1 Tax=Ruegeria sp. SCSIO 43209 TaxID=2793010 RepID=UPI001CA8B307|nr:hypothetical protein [Ruegeria sp. SCSIO 43209]UAB91540.1 hypothetical protein I5192_20105 [Ruegeria sp. SCSIO 43209]
MTDRDDITPEEALTRTQVRIKTEGLEAATDAALQLLRDPKAPAQAKSATINAIYRASGLFGRTDDETQPEPHEMTPEQLQRHIRNMERSLRTAATGADGVFS